MAKPDLDRSSVEEEKGAMPLSEVAGALFTAGQRFAQDVGELLGLEARRAFRALTWMVALAVVAGLLGAAMWLALLAAAYIGLMDLGIPNWGAFLVLAGANLVGALISLLIIRRLSSALLFRTTRRVLLGEPRPAELTPTGLTRYEPAESQDTGT
ncbi:MAG TPA: phage holin family protein [Nitrococcus sp.]|nr:phage holin family protein [Nitrococcus sp.]